MYSGVKLGRIFGITINLDFSWFIILLLVILSLHGSAPGQRYEPWVWSIITALFIFGSVLAHEISHSYVALQKGIPMRGITLFIFGGVAETTEEPRTAIEEFQIAAAGPGMSIIIALICWALVTLHPLLHLGKGVVWMLDMVKQINVMLVLFNLFPGFPLDGGRLFRAVLWKATGNIRKSTRIASITGQVFGFFLMFIGIMSIFRGILINGIWLIFIGWFLEQAARSSYQQVLLRRALSGIKVSEVMTKNIVSVSSTLTLEQVVNDYFFKYHYNSFPVVDNGMVKGFIRLNDIRNIDRNRWATAQVIEVMIPMQEQFLISAETDAVEALNRMLRTDSRKLMVTQSGAIIGMVTLPDLMALFKVKTDLGE